MNPNRHRVSTASGTTPVSAIAADTKRYPGSTCRQTSGGSLGYFAGTIFNGSSTSELNVICPLLLDTGSIASGRVTLYDRNNAVANSCTIFSSTPNYNGTGTVFEDFETVGTTTGESSTDPFDETFGAIGAGDYYYATCSIARTSSGNASDLATISITEN